jgi:hypothetical protein
LLYLLFAFHDGLQRCVVPRERSSVLADDRPASTGPMLLSTTIDSTCNTPDERQRYHKLIQPEKQNIPGKYI